MPVFIALLRGVNVGKAKRVAMADWRALLSGLGYQRVATLLNSGNAVFWVDDGQPVQLAQAIAGAMARNLNLEVPVVVMSADALALAVADNTLAELAPDHARLLAVFAQDAATLAGLQRLAPLVAPPEAFLLGRHAAYLHCPAGVLQSQAGAALLGQQGQAVTSRNWATVLKLQLLAMQCQMPD